MNKQIVIGVLLLVAGGAAFIIANFIDDKVAEGREKYAECFGAMAQIARLCGLWPQKCVDAPKQLREGAAMAELSVNIGVPALIIGLILIVWGFRKRR